MNFETLGEVGTKLSRPLEAGKIALFKLVFLFLKFETLITQRFIVCTGIFYVSITNWR